jgi:hypothetical protein
MKVVKIITCAGNYSGRERSPCYKSGGGRSDKTGAGNTAAIALVKKSPIVQSAYRFLLGQAARIEDAKLRKETLDALDDPCIHHRANLTEAQKDAIVATLTAQGLINPADGAAIVGGVKAGIFPPVLDDSSACPKLPQAFYSAPGSTSVNGHHSYPGGLVVHESSILPRNTARSTVILAPKDFRPFHGRIKATSRLPKETLTLIFSSTRISSLAHRCGTTGPSPSSSSGMPTAANSPN